MRSGLLFGVPVAAPERRHNPQVAFGVEHVPVRRVPPDGGPA
jgi:hypothetical protein